MPIDHRQTGTASQTDRQTWTEKKNDIQIGKKTYRESKERDKKTETDKTEKHTADTNRMSADVTATDSNLTAMSDLSLMSFSKLR